MMRHSILAAAVLSATALNLAGCKSKSVEREEASWRMNTPLAHDPTDRDIIGPWWSNGRQLLHLSSDGSYALHDENNRYRKPSQRGRWAQQSYAVLLLEPYSKLKREPLRVAITKRDGCLTLEVPGLAPMRSMASPPAAREDDFIGSWEGSLGALRLNPDLTYEYTARSGLAVGSDAPAGTARSQRGRWRFKSDGIVLSPSTPNVEASTLRVRDVPPSGTHAPAGAALGDAPASAPARTSATVEYILEGLGGELVKVRDTAA